MEREITAEAGTLCGERQQSAADPLRRMAGAIAVALSSMALFGFAARPDISRAYLLQQDIYIVALFGAALSLFAMGRWPRLGIKWDWRIGWGGVVAVAAAATLLLWAGTYALLAHYPLTRDEHMVVFDMAVFREGMLAAPLPPEWRAFRLAMTPAFLLDFAGDAAWVSAYMPGNAALRMGFAAVADPALMNPLLVGLGAIALFSIARQLFPASPSAQAIALLLYFTSAQMLAAAMTTYAMTAHLALNLVWLALFLRAGKAGHGGAIAVGAIATGLHQVVFHPLFVLPFLEHLRRRGEWRTALIYIACYAAIGIFWMSYQAMATGSVGATPESGAGAGFAAFLDDRVLSLLTKRDGQGLIMMSLNLVRFATWQNLALIPLCVAAIPLARRAEGLAQPLYYGVLLTIAAMFLLLPSQGHGWGYRYVHGLLGSFALLGAYGWERLRRESTQVQDFVAAATLLTVLVSVPFLLWKANSFVRPYAVVNEHIERIDADFVVIDTERISFAIDEVRNDPYLRNRPLRFSSKHLSADEVAELCARGSVTFVSRRKMQQLGLGVEHWPINARFDRLRAGLTGKDCLRDENCSRCKPLRQSAVSGSQRIVSSRRLGKRSPAKPER